MPGTIEGGRKASETNRKKYGGDFYRRIGAKGGKMGRTGGFFANRELARTAGAIGGRKSRRGPNLKRNTDLSEADQVGGYEELQSAPKIVTK